jgi:hypothetical protein
MCLRRCGWRLLKLFPLANAWAVNRHRVALAHNYVLDSGAYHFQSRQLTRAASAGPSSSVRRFESVPIQGPAGIALEVGDCAVRMSETSYYDVYVSGSNMGSYELPPSVLTDLADSVQHNLGSWCVQLIGFLRHDLLGIPG